MSDDPFFDNSDNSGWASSDSNPYDDIMAYKRKVCGPKPMTIKELIGKLQQYDDDNIVIIGDERNGWCNIDLVRQDGDKVSIIEDYVTDDKD